MDDSIARSRRRRAAGPLGVSQAEAVAPGSFVSDLAFDASFQGGLQGEGERAGSGGLWGSGASGGAKEQESFDVAVDDPPRAAAGQFMASFSGGSSFGGNSSSLFSGMQLFGSQPPVVMQQQQMASVQQRQQMQNFSSSLGWQNMTSLVGGQQSLGQSQSQALMHGLGFGSEQGIAPSSSLGHLIPGEENWIGRDGDAIPASEMSLGGDSSDSEDSSKGEAGRLRRRKEKLGKGGSSGDKLWRKLRGMKIRGPFLWMICRWRTRSMAFYSQSEMQLRLNHSQGRNYLSRVIIDSEMQLVSRLNSSVENLISVVRSGAPFWLFRA